MKNLLNIFKKYKSLEGVDLYKNIKIDLDYFNERQF